MEAFGGAERVTAEIAATFPDAPVYTILGRPSVAKRMGIEDRLSTLLPARDQLLQNYRSLAPLYPALVRSARLPDADVVVSSSYAYAHGFESRNRAPKLCYCHGPLRHLWSHSVGYGKTVRGGIPGQLAFGLYRAVGRAADKFAAESVDAYMTQSRFTAAQIREAYDRPAQVLAPPVDCKRFVPSGKPADDYFLFAGRLVEAYKRPSLVVEAFKRMPDRRLLIAGAGPALQSLREQATPNIEFLGHLDDDDLVRAMQGCQAAIFPSVDDYGLVPLEVNACARPVLAFYAGGSLHTVRQGVTGDFFFDQTADAIVDAVERFDPDRYDATRIRDHAMQRSTERFRAELHAAVEQLAAGGDPATDRDSAPDRSAAPMPLGSREPVAPRFSTVA
jgi:glycosyltransferase involved in cell wall biosynthesis